MKNLHTYPPLKMEQTERSYLPTYEDEIDRVFRNVAIQNSDAGELPRRKHTAYRTRRMFEIEFSLICMYKHTH